jgi:hypothetical protein
VVLDLVRERQPPFSPDDVTAEFAALLKAYGIGTVRGDRYGGLWPRERFAVHGIEYLTADKPKSDIYRDLLPALNSGRVERLDHARLMAQLCGLERRTARGGRDSIDHAPGAHDDVANAVAGAVLLVLRQAAEVMTFNLPILFDPRTGETLSIAASSDSRVPEHYLTRHDEPWRPYIGASGEIKSTAGWCPPGGWTKRRSW